MQILGVTLITAMLVIPAITASLTPRAQGEVCGGGQTDNCRRQRQNRQKVDDGKFHRRDMRSQAEHAGQACSPRDARYTFAKDLIMHIYHSANRSPVIQPFGVWNLQVHTTTTHRRAEIIMPVCAV